MKKRRARKNNCSDFGSRQAQRPAFISVQNSNAETQIERGFEPALSRSGINPAPREEPRRALKLSC